MDQVLGHNPDLSSFLYDGSNKSLVPVGSVFLYYFTYSTNSLFLFLLSPFFASCTMS